MAKKMKRSTTEDESSPGSTTASSSEDIPREETPKRKRRRSQARKNTSKKKDKEIMNFLAEFKEEVCKQTKQAADESKCEMSKQLEKLREEMCKQSKQVIESKEEMYKQLDKLRKEMCKQSKQATESKEEICKQLEKVNQDNQEMHKQLTEMLIDLRKQWDLHINGSSGDDSDAPRSQSNQVQPPRYRLVFKSGVIDKIHKGQPFDISIALVDGNDQTVENGPLANATVELVVVKAEFNQHNNQYNWSREDFESNIKKAQGNSATIDVDQSFKSIVSDGRFNLVKGVKCHSGSKIFRNSGNKKVRLGVMVVSPKEERVLEGLSNPFYVRGHDRLRHNRSNMQRQSLVDDGYEEQNGAMPNMQNPSWANSTQYEETRLNVAGDPRKFPIIGNTIMLSPELNTTEGLQSQLPFLGNTNMLSTEPSTNQDQEALTQQYQVPHLPMWAQTTNNQTDELSAPMDGNVRNLNYMSNNYVPVPASGTPYYTIQRTLPVRLIWDRLNVELIKHHWNLHDHLSVTTVYKPSNRKLLPNSTCQLSMSRLSLKGQSLTLQTLSCTEKEDCLLIKRHIYQGELPDNLNILRAVRKSKQIYDYRQLHRQHLTRFRSLDYIPLENTVQWPHTLIPTLGLCQHLTKLHLFGVMSCEELPQSCQLQVLQILCLEKLRSLCSHVVSMPFPELRELRLHDLESLEKWVATEGKEDQPIFPELEKIVIKNCPKLTRLPEAPKLKDTELDEGTQFSSLTMVQKEATQTHHKRGGVLIESLEPDGLDERPTITKRHNKYQLRFVNKVCGEYYTWDKIKADDGNLLKVALFDENNMMITSGPLSSASVEIVALHGDFNVDGKDRWTSEEFSNCVVCPSRGEEASSLIGGDRVLSLAHGEACLSHAFFQIPSFVSRTQKFKMAVMVANAQDERIQEGISEPFRVMNRHVEDKNYSLLQTIAVLYSIFFLFLTSILLIPVRNNL